MAVAAAGLVAVDAAQAAVAAAAPAARKGACGKLAPPGPSRPQTSSTAASDALVSPASLHVLPPGRRCTGREVLAAADAVPKIRATVRRHPGSERYVYLKGDDRWQVSYFAPARRPRRGRRGEDVHPRREIAQVLFSDRAGRVQETWTGFQVAWTMARGYEGAFGRRSSAVYVWIPLLLAFVVPFADRRRPLCWRNLDLLVLASFAVSLAFFSHGEIGVSVPLAYPPLLYLLVRMLAYARVRARAEPARTGPPVPVTWVPATWLAVGLVFLLAFRIGMNVMDSNVIDVGYAGVIGANRIVEGKQVYGDFPADNEHGDTYGPANYLAYVPWERIWPWSGRWDALPAAHGAAAFFDLATMLMLWLLGRRLRGPGLGLALVYGWAAFPFTLYALSTNTNDALVSALVVGCLLVASSPVLAGALSAVTALTKFAPLALVPLLAVYAARRRPELGWRGWRSFRLATFAFVFAVVACALVLPFALQSGPEVLYERTLAYQSERGSPFSIWGIVGGLEVPQRIVQAGALALVLAVAVWPRRRDTFTLAALAAAILIAVQLGVSHWFYLYVVWFFPLVLLVIVTSAPAPARESARWRRRGAVATR